MNDRLFSLCTPCPDGFTFCREFRVRDFRRAPFALYAPSSEASREFLGRHLSLLAGVILIPGDHYSSEEAAPLVAQIIIPPSMLPCLADFAAHQLIQLDRYIASEERRSYLTLENKRFELNNQRASEEFTRFRESLLHEIEERRATETALRESERKFRAIFDQTFQFTGLLALDGTLIEANRVSLEFAGAGEDVIGKPFWETPWWTHSPELQEKLRAAIRKAAQGEFVRFEATHPAPDGNLHYVDFSLKPVTDETGKVVLLIPEGRDITEHFRLLEALRLREHYQRALLDNFPFAAWMKDVGGRYLAVNRQLAAYLGFASPDELVGKTSFDILPPELSERIAAEDSKVLTSGRTKHAEEKLPANGEYRWFDVYQSPVAIDGQVIGTVGCNWDITERKRAEEELAFRNVILSTQQESSIDGILIVDESGIIISYNRRFVDLWEIPPELVEAKDSTPILQMAKNMVVDPETFLARVMYLYDHKKEKSHEEIFLKDGRVFDRYSSPMWGDDGKYYGRVWYFRDITEWKRMVETLGKSESVLRKIFDSIPDLLSLIDRDLRIVRSNWHGGYEYVPEDIRDNSPFCHEAYYPGQDKPCENCHTIEVFRTGKPAVIEKFNPRIGFMEMHAYPVFDDAGNVIMAIEHVRDITERRRLEEELRKAHKLESLGVLAGGIAHDFNNLLTGILGNISLAKILTDPNLKSFKRLEEAEKAVYHARDLTQQLMTFSKGGSPVKKTASIGQIVMDSASFVLRGSNVRCRFSVPENVWPVKVDEGQMNQVINNLIINADQSMAEGGILEIVIENLNAASENEVSLTEGRYVKISISDRGVGIPEQHLHKIFDPYFTTKQKGSGLGLATVYSIIKNHDGNIGVESKLGVGTTFHVYIPASETGLLEVTERKESSHAGSGKIMVMDDEEIIREVAAEILGHLGYIAVVCCDGSEAIELYRQAIATKEPFTAVIMDLTIPGGMGGKETMKKLLEIDKGVVGIVSSGYCNDPILSSYWDYGFSGIVGKPYSLDELGKVLHDLLTGGEYLQQ